MKEKLNEIEIPTVHGSSGDPADGGDELSSLAPDPYADTDTYSYTYADPHSDADSNPHPDSNPNS